VQGLAEPIELSLPLMAWTVAEVSAVSCLYWDEPRQMYSGEGCAAQPNPAPPGASLFWKAGAALPRDVNGTVLLDEAWSLGGWGSESDWASDSNSDWGSHASGLLEGCEEKFAAYFDEYDGADAGLRKFVGEGCELSRANNTLQCWWDWRRQTFTGSGCVLADTLQCMCTHLGDFQAGMNMGTGELKVRGAVALFLDVRSGALGGNPSPPFSQYLARSLPHSVSSELLSTTLTLRCRTSSPSSTRAR
jgi:hypothetical protein